MTVSVTVVTVILADQPLESEAAGDGWLDRFDDSDLTGDQLDEAVATLDRVRAADAAASGVPVGAPTRLDQVLAGRIGYGEGDQVASGRFLDAVDVDARGDTENKRRERAARTGATARTAAILGGRDTAGACEVLIPRIRFDFDSGNQEAALAMIAPAIEATIAELEFALEDEDHERDLDQLEEMLPGLGGILERTLGDQTEEADLEKAEQALNVAERVLRRYRILTQ